MFAYLKIFKIFDVQMTQHTTYDHNFKSPMTKGVTDERCALGRTTSRSRRNFNEPH